MIFSMDTTNRTSNRRWKILCWNIIGINAISKWTSLRSKILESKCDIVYIQETKREIFYQAYIRNFCPRQFDSFDYIPSVGSSGGTLVVWKGSKITGQVIFQNEFAMNLEFVSTISNASWVLTHIYMHHAPQMVSRDSSAGLTTLRCLKRQTD
jgi:exonuclease III